MSRLGLGVEVGGGDGVYQRSVTWWLTGQNIDVSVFDLVSIQSCRLLQVVLWAVLLNILRENNNNKNIKKKKKKCATPPPQVHLTNQVKWEKKQQQQNSTSVLVGNTINGWYKITWSEVWTSWKRYADWSAHVHVCRSMPLLFSGPF